MKKKKSRTQKEQDKLYLKTWDYDPSEEEVDALYDDDFDKWLMSDECQQVDMKKKEKIIITILLIYVVQQFIGIVLFALID